MKKFALLNIIDEQARTIEHLNDKLEQANRDREFIGLFLHQMGINLSHAAERMSEMADPAKHSPFSKERI